TGHSSTADGRRTTRYVRRGRRVPAEGDHSSFVATARRELKRSGTAWNVSRSGTQRARGRPNGPGRGTDDHGWQPLGLGICHLERVTEIEPELSAGNPTDPGL